MTEKKETTDKRKRSPAKKNEEKQTNAIIRIPVSPKDTLAMAKDVMDQYSMIASPTPKKFIKQRKGRGDNYFDYVEANYVQLRLNAIFHFNWDFDIVEYTIDKEQGMIALMGKLTVRFVDGSVVSKTAWGGSDIACVKVQKRDAQGRGETYADGNKVMIKSDQMVDLADSLKSASSDCIKKCASMLGICWDVYAGYGQETIQEPVVEEQKEEEQVGEVIEAEIVPETEPTSPEPPSDEQEPPPIDAAEGAEIADVEAKQAIKDAILASFEVTFRKSGKDNAYKQFKAFLYIWQGEKKRSFVEMNEFNNISLMMGNAEDLKHLHPKMNLNYALSEWKKWTVEQEEKEKDTKDSEIPF